MARYIAPIRLADRGPDPYAAAGPQQIIDRSLVSPRNPYGVPAIAALIAKIDAKPVAAPEPPEPAPEPIEVVACGCGCGATFPRWSRPSRWGQARVYVDQRHQDRAKAARQKAQRGADRRAWQDGRFKTGAWAW